MGFIQVQLPIKLQRLAIGPQQLQTALQRLALKQQHQVKTQLLLATKHRPSAKTAPPGAVTRRLLAAAQQRSAHVHRQEQKTL